MFAIMISNCQLPWATQQIAQILTNIDWTLKHSNSGSRKAIEEPKKRKIIKIWREKWWSSQIQSSCWGKVTRRLYLYLKNRFLGQKWGFCKVLRNVFQGQTKVFLGCKGHTWTGTIEKTKKNHQVWSHEGSTFKKKGPHFGQNSRPGESDPYVKVSRHAYMKGDEIKISNHPILDSSDVFCVQGD